MSFVLGDIPGPANSFHAEITGTIDGSTDGLPAQLTCTLSGVGARGTLLPHQGGPTHPGAEAFLHHADLHHADGDAAAGGSGAPRPLARVAPP
eukprot:237252-Prymnesium_polylepis.1